MLRYIALTKSTELLKNAQRHLSLQRVIILLLVEVGLSVDGCWLVRVAADGWLYFVLYSPVKEDPGTSNRLLTLWAIELIILWNKLI